MSNLQRIGYDSDWRIMLASYLLLNNRIGDMVRFLIQAAQCEPEQPSRVSQNTTEHVRNECNR